MAFSKITDEDRLGKGNVGQPDTPLLTTTEMQEQMDSLPNLGIDKFNAFIDEISDPTAAQNIGCEAPLGMTVATQTLYSVISAIARIATNSDELAHSHANKDSLDTLTDELVASLSAISVMLNGIERVGTIVTDDEAAIPTSKAVINYVNGVDISSNILNAIYPIGAIYLTTTTDPDTLFGTTGKWELINTALSGIKTYKRIG